MGQGWSDGFPLVMPTEDVVGRFVELVRGDNEPLPPITPRLVIPTLETLAANAVMAGCRPEYFPAVLAAARAVLDPEYNLHGSLATTHSCAPMLMFNGPIRNEIEINFSSNCFGQGHQANATIGRALQLILSNPTFFLPNKIATNPFECRRGTAWSNGSFYSRLSSKICILLWRK